MYPHSRLQRQRQSESIRDLVKENALTASDFIYPIFVSEVCTEPQEVTALPGVYQHTLESLKSEIKECVDIGIKSILLFGIPVHKDDQGSESYHSEGIVQRAIRQIKSQAPQLTVIADCCLCEYTDHGHCAVLTDNGKINNDETLNLLSMIKNKDYLHIYFSGNIELKLIGKKISVRLDDLNQEWPTIFTPYHNV